MQRVLSGLLILAMSAPWPGCQLAYFLTDPDRGRPVQAEYNKIGNRRVAVLVWADRTTLDIDPKARRRVCDAITYEMKKHLPDAVLIPSRDVQAFQEEGGLNWESMRASELCKQLKCDLVLRVDLLEYTTRAAATKELRRGRVRGTVNLYECGEGAMTEAVYETEIVANFPTDRQSSINELTDGELMREAVAQFGQATAKKFYDHEESLRGPERR